MGGGGQGPGHARRDKHNEIGVAERGNSSATERRISFQPSSRPRQVEKARC